MSRKASNLTQEDRGMLRKMFKRSWLLFHGVNMLNMQGNGYSMGLLPAIKRFYKAGSEEEKQALIRSAQFFNCTYETAPFIWGLNAAMERENAETEGFDTESITATKAALMGPLSAIGDSVFWGVIRTIAASIAIPLASAGNILGPLLFILIYHIPSILTRYSLLRLGYNAGGKFLKSISESGLLKGLTYCVSIVGMIMVGAMTAQFVTVTSPLTINFSSGETLALQEILDSVFKGLLPLGFVFGMFALLRKKVSLMWLALGSMVVGILLTFLQIV